MPEIKEHKPATEKKDEPKGPTTAELIDQLASKVSSDKDALLVEILRGLVGR